MSTSWRVPCMRSKDDGTLEPDSSLFDLLRRGFCDGNVREIIALCRDADNVPYTPEEIDEMMEDLNNNGHTLNLPFCFTEGAMALKNSILNQVFRGCFMGGGGRYEDDDPNFISVMDLEVGVYITRAHGAEATWHYDNNHNFTFQLFGSKDWHTVEDGNNVNVIGSRGLRDPPRNRAEQVNRTPNFSKERITRLEAGMGIYVPPGHWHRVVPVTEDPVCLSIDIRIASVTMARWFCENVFAKFMCEPSFGYIKDTGQNETLEQDVAIGWHKYRYLHPRRFPGDFLHTCLSRHVEHLKAVLSGDWRYRFCDPPVAMPFEPDLSDGMDLCASLEFLIDKLTEESTDRLAELAKEMKEGYVRKWKVALTPFVAVTKKEADDGVVLHMRHTSGLTNMDYQRYGILCPFDCETLIDRIIDRALTSDDVRAILDGYEVGRDAEGDLLTLLTWSNFVNLEPESPAARPAATRASSGVGSTGVGAKRRRG
uniref:JmjC domain-containing protein n=1 Tax=Micromonas pusilla TaxID=38833 RepID=A0A7S0PW39_MICPS